MLVCVLSETYRFDILASTTSATTSFEEPAAHLTELVKSLRVDENTGALDVHAWPEQVQHLVLECLSRSVHVLPKNPL